MIGKLDRVPLREVWKHEATDSTRWLEENIDVLGDALDLNLWSAEREHAAGLLSVDLVAEAEGGNVARTTDREVRDVIGGLSAGVAVPDRSAQGEEEWAVQGSNLRPWD